MSQNGVPVVLAMGRDQHSSRIRYTYINIQKTGSRRPKQIGRNGRSADGLHSDAARCASAGILVPLPCHGPRQQTDALLLQHHSVHEELHARSRPPRRTRQGRAARGTGPYSPVFAELQDRLRELRRRGRGGSADEHIDDV